MAIKINQTIKWRWKSKIWKRNRTPYNSWQSRLITLLQSEAFPTEERVGVPGLVHHYCPILGRGCDASGGQHGTRREGCLCSRLPLTQLPLRTGQRTWRQDTGANKYEPKQIPMLLQETTWEEPLPESLSPHSHAPRSASEHPLHASLRQHYLQLPMTFLTS